VSLTFLIWHVAQKRHEARIAKQYQHNLPSGIV
jgi:hypothetical protein